MKLAEVFDGEVSSAGGWLCIECRRAERLLEILRRMQDFTRRRRRIGVDAIELFPPSAAIRSDDEFQSREIRELQRFGEVARRRIAHRHLGRGHGREQSVEHRLADQRVEVGATFFEQVSEHHERRFTFEHCVVRHRRVGVFPKIEVAPTDVEVLILQRVHQLVNDDAFLRHLRADSAGKVFHRLRRLAQREESAARGIVVSEDLRLI